MRTTTEKQKAWLLFAIALIARLIAWPFSQIVEADATSRLFLAEHAVHHGGELASLQWQSLHIYFLSLAQLISGERYIGPVIFTLLLGAAAIIPFYLFTRNIFNERGAFYAALLFSFSPLVFRLSFVPLSEIFFVFFTTLSLWALSEGIIGERKIKWSILAGIFMTIASGSRFEPWLLAILFGLILLALKEWKMFFLFGSVSAIFPVCWMIFCYVKTGTVFASIDMIAYQNMDIGNAGTDIDRISYLRKIWFFPISFIAVLTPLAAFLIPAMLPRIFRSIRSQKARALFSLLFVIMFAFSVYQSIGGMLAKQHRYTITVVMLGLPFWAVWFENEKRIRMKQIVSIVLACLFIPWSFYWHRISWNRLALGNPDANHVIALTISGTFRETQAVPRIEQQEFVPLAEKINCEVRPGDGVFVDWTGWASSYYLGHRAPVPPNDILLSCEQNPEPVNYEYFNNFFSNHSHGLILLSDLSILSGETSLHGSLLEIKNIPGGLLLEPLMTQKHYRLFRYQTVSQQETEILRQKLNFTPPLYTIVKDPAYFECSIPCDANLMAGLWQEANKKRRTLDEQIRLTAEYMAEQEKLKQNNTDTLK